MMERERELFDACLDLGAAERAALLERECGEDTVLRQRLERLLAAHEQAASKEHAQNGARPRLDADACSFGIGGAERALCAFEPAELRVAEGLDVSERIGRYELVRVIGEGGMGTVYEARQLEPVVRQVAIKVIRMGASNKAHAAEILSRFAAERQALAVMDHPNVAKVFDAGETLLGYPYFAMEFVDGLPLTEYCTQHRLGLRDRLRLFVQLCHAVQHAHLKGVIHRDLKPANVLVTGAPAEAMAKVIDFGISKAIGETAGAAHRTRTGVPLGTAAYMSPEQAGFGRGDVDTRSDIYSLGVILYELIAERLPADPGDAGYAAFLGQLAAGDLRIAAPMGKGDDDDLNWIALKALEADRSRRYVSAAALAEDVERFLRQEPVSAHPPTVAYRISKYVRRNRAQAVAASVALVALIGGGIAAGAGYVRAVRAEAVARDEAAAASEVSDFLMNTFKVTDPGETRGRTVTARELLENASEQIESRLSGQPKVKQRLMTSLSRAYSSLGLYTEGRSMAEKALTGRGGGETLEDADALLALSAAEWQKDRFEIAQKAAERAVAIRTRLLGPNDVKVAQALQELGTVEMLTDKFEPSLGHLQRALAIRRTTLGEDHLETGNVIRAIAGVYLRRGKKGDMKLSLEHFQQSLRIMEARLGKEHPAYASNLDDVGIALNKPSEAIGWHEKAYEVRRRIYAEDHVQMGFSHYNLGRTYLRMGKLPDARGHLVKAVSIRTAKLGEANSQTADAMRSLAMVEVSMGRRDEGLRLFERVVEIGTEAFGADSENTLLDRSNLGVMLVVMKRYDEALPHLRAGLKAKVFFQWNGKIYDPVRKDPRYVALAAEQERIKAGGVPESTFQYAVPK
ncbi:MAG: serine/threonine protein kinase [Acidobacteria bacterium]|nr:serine/threonine protein kinase [Acidobacteriota bacterium]